MVVNNISLDHAIVRYENGKLLDSIDEIVTESPLTIFINDEEFATMVCTPHDLEELIIGFLASEGVIRFQKDIQGIQIDESRGVAYISLNRQISTNQNLYSKRFIGSCCGKSRQFYFQSDAKNAKTSTSTTTIRAEQCVYLMNDLQESSTVFKDTGGVHNAALCTTKELIVSRTDIGRHNALDKLYGYSLLHHISVRDKILVFSGRISSEVLLKAAKIGVGIILSKSAPTNLAIKLADDLNITAVGFIRDESFNVYSHPERIIL